MKTILFMGDSITDCCRDKNDDNFKGHGIATAVSTRLSYAHPGELNFINRGISGNRIVDIYARIKSDAVNLAPDIMTLLCGVNDVWHEIERQNGVSAEKFEKIYTMYIEELHEALPNLKIIMIEPFLLRGSANEERYDEFYKEVRLRAAACERIAKKFNIPYVYLQDKLSSLAEKIGNEALLRDGVHPNITGIGLISDELCKEIEKAL